MRVATRRIRAAHRGGGRIGVVKRSAVGTGPLRRSPAVHSPPIDRVVFPEPSQRLAAGNLVLEGASRLDAFSADPVPTWLPGGAPSGTAGTPEVGPPQSSRTRGDAPQVSSRPRQIGTDLSHDGLNPARVPLSLANSQTLGTFSSPRMR